MSKPILSFCIPTYNRANRVYNCVSHILQYPGDEIEVVVSNNASTDNTTELLSAISDKRLKVFSNEKNIEALNLPLVVSRSGAQWAALMSDEDIVNLDDLPYFLTLLQKVMQDGVGGIIYSFPPICSWGCEYVCRTQLESLHAGFRHSGHITGHIINMDYFELGDLSDYNNCRRNGYDDPAYLGKPFVMEPQHEILRRVASKHTIMFTDRQLCLFGKDELTEVLDFNKIDDFWGGYSPDYREIVIATALESLKTASIINEIQHTAAAMSAHEMMLMVVMEFYIGVVYGTHKYRPALLKYAQEKLQYTIDDAKEKILGHLDSFLKQYPQKLHPELFYALRYYIGELFKGNDPEFEHTQLSFPLRTMLGGTLFWIFISSRILILNSTNDKGYFKSRLIRDINDTFELDQTNNMKKLLALHNVDYVINNFNDVKTFRAHYLRAVAYFLKKDYNNAKEEFNNFLHRLNNPLSMSDIMTGSYSVVATYYYLGYIYHELGNIDKSLEFYARFKTLSDDLLLGHSFYKRRLWFNTSL